MLGDFEEGVGNGPSSELDVVRKWGNSVSGNFNKSYLERRMTRLKLKV